MSTELLAKACHDTSRLAGDAERWLDDEANAATVGRERADLVRYTRKVAFRAERLRRAAERPMCVGVFGPSQAGKSYLVEVLARPENGALRARFDGSAPVDFLAEINPIGEKEATGLVTRFSARSADTPTPAGAPVRLRVLTESDLIKVLCNSFLHDGDATKENPPRAEDITALLGTLRARAVPGTGRFSDAEIDDLQDYLLDQARGTRTLDALARYWDEARTLASGLDLEGRARLFAPLWGGHAAFTGLYRDLAGALERLGHPDEIFAPLGALVPREGSILDVATLAGLGAPGGGDTLLVHGASGGPVALPRATVAAITAELRIEIADAPRAFLQEADLLDFPGARSRQKVDLSHFLDAHPDALKETFLRGKVAYLFDRYVAEQELTTMLLCIRPSNQEVVTLPDLVERWIAQTHGSTPEARVSLPNLLFLVMTWFDSHFVDKAGDAGQDAGLRFRNRIEASLLGFFGKAHTWPRQWTPGTPFRNAFWFRNPNYPAESVIRYEGRREVGFLPEKQERIAELRRGFVALPEAAAHFQDPARAFDEALRLNDGGVGYLVENLARVCRPELKAAQIASRLDGLRTELRERLGRFHVALDIETRLAERREAAGHVFDALDETVATGGFGSLLRELLIDVGTLADALHGAAQAPNEAPAPSGPARIARPGAIPRPGAPGPGVRSPAAPAASDRERGLARAAVAAWIGAMRRRIEADGFALRFRVPVEVMEIIVGELITLARRADVEAAIAADLRALATVERAEQSTAKLALIAATRLNRLSGDLGFALVPPAGERPPIQDETGDRVAFAARPVAYDARTIGSAPAPFGHTYATDWFHGFYRVVEDNAKSAAGVTIDLEQNGRLGAILTGLDPRPTG
ncbi:MAG: virulence factor SrfC family protein [Methylobacterium sp.]|uniref:virulence factor SrfC family protein n=1 Tax=Methylobacterium sp. TaxID=409 RepID=UPI0027281EB7|nr:virulence factor SrfC family protein [Methylobacterium sp.]MDO9428512.1 virulence factor SrfC family protein [Methylobacterium sp.]